MTILADGQRENLRLAGHSTIVGGGGGGGLRTFVLLTLSAQFDVQLFGGHTIHRRREHTDVG
jgi:hypothetical protein